MTELFELSTEVTEASKQAAEALGVELNDIEIKLLGKRTVEITFKLMSYDGVNE